MSKPKFNLEQRVWFLKSMRLCKVVQIIPMPRKKDPPNYIVQAVADSEIQLYATEEGLALESEYEPERETETQ